MKTKNKTTILIKKTSIKFLLLFIVTYTAILLCGCNKITKIKKNTINDIEYIEPKQCFLRKINKVYYQTKIKDNNIFFSNRSIDAFLNNTLDYKLAVNEYQQCCKTNETYYKNIINILITKKN